jgi:uncharacterized protein (TIGR00297 family)
VQRFVTCDYTIVIDSCLQAILLAGLFAVTARRLRWLTYDGAIAAWGVGAVVLGLGGAWWAAALVAFFATGTLLTRVGRDRKVQPEHAGKGRAADQVLCTGGVGALLAVMWGSGVVPEPAIGALYPAFLGSLAAAAADTWATEIGMLSPRPPRMITSGRQVAPGTSGGVTPLGSVAGVAGAMFIAGIGAGSYPGGVPPGGAAAGAGAVALAASVTIAGTLAMFVDSVLGATVQAVYRRPDGSVIEEAHEGDVRIRGVPWMTNAVVNLLATASGATIAGLLAVRW